VFLPTCVCIARNPAPEVKIAILFDNFGPYHAARMAAAARVCQLLAIQVHEHSREYGWLPPHLPPTLSSATIGPTDGASTRESFSKLWRMLTDFSPDSVFIPGWSNRHSLAALHWCVRNATPAVLMSESTSNDLPRHRFKEWLKACIVSMCSAALVGGLRQAEYVTSLGMPADCVFLGYDVVDNEYFKSQTELVRAQSGRLRAEFALPERYFLASARFVRSKNLSYLIREYSSYNAGAKTARNSGRPWSLVILGDGPERRLLEAQISRLQLDNCILLPGFKQYAELPVYYGLSSAFVHASTSEPWGLVVNEAMASGLPLLVSERCGCVRELVRPGRTGFGFDPGAPGQLSELMLRLSSCDTERIRLGQAAASLISRWGPERFSVGLQQSSTTAIVQGLRNVGWWPRILLQCLLRN
jgi:glycosyltransferase involved in cell wall biosynthesis